MSHHHRHSEEKQPINLKLYLRLLGFTRKYWFRLSVGIFFGMLVGGSLLFALMIIPQMVSAVEAPMQTADRSPAAVKRTAAETTGDPQLDKLLDQLRDYSRRLSLPVEIHGREVRITAIYPCSFEVANPDGRVAWQLFAIYGLGFVFAWAAKTLGEYLNKYYMHWVGIRVVADMRAHIFRRLVDQSLRFYGKRDVGDLISRATNDTSMMEHCVAQSVSELTCCPVQLLACLCAVWIACAKAHTYTLLFILLAGMVVMVVPIAVMGSLIRKVCRAVYARIAVVISRMHEVFTGIRVVKAYHTEDMETEKFEAINNRYFKQQIRAIRLQLLVTPMTELVAVAGTLVFLIFAYGQGTSLATLSAMLSPAFMAYKPLKELSKSFTYIQRSMAAADRYFETVDQHSELPEKADAVELAGFSGSIELEDVTFSYDDRRILDHVSFSIPRGSTVAIVGETGSGKSTIANLVARFYDTDSGRILIDGVDVRDYTIASLRKTIGVVTQEAILFNTTIAENIAYGNPSATREEIIEAAVQANAHNFIAEGHHSDGYDTNVGEKGFKLSGGEKQRVSIARAILRNPPILILDEATSALDTVTEKLVQDALTRVMKNRTVLAIAHRLSTIRNADRIIVLHEGHIIESGTHGELLEKNGAYRKLYDTQFVHDTEA